MQKWIGVYIRNEPITVTGNVNSSKINSFLGSRLHCDFIRAQCRASRAIQPPNPYCSSMIELRDKRCLIFIIHLDHLITDLLRILTTLITEFCTNWCHFSVKLWILGNLKSKGTIAKNMKSPCRPRPSRIQSRIVSAVNVCKISLPEMQ